MIQVIDITKQVFDGRYQHRDPEGAIGTMLHRCGVNMVDRQVLGFDAVSVVEAFIGRRPEWAEVARVTGGQNAYTFLVGGDCGPTEYDGRVWQALPLDEIGWHALRYSAPYIGLSWIADPRRKPPSPVAWHAMVELCAVLCRWRGWDPYKAIKGHGEVPGAHDGSKAPGQPNACPGLSQRDLNLFRDDVAIALQQPEVPGLGAAGILLAAESARV